MMGVSHTLRQMTPGVDLSIYTFSAHALTRPLILTPTAARTGAFSPLFRLHGHRVGGPPSNECGATNGDNELWNIAPEAANYDAIVTMMRLRENLRECFCSPRAHSCSGRKFQYAVFLAYATCSIQVSIHLHPHPPCACPTCRQLRG